MEIYQQIFFTNLALSFGLLHLMLYLYNRRLKSNLFFSIIVVYVYTSTSYVRFSTFNWLNYWEGVTNFFQLVFVYSDFREGCLIIE